MQAPFTQDPQAQHSSRHLLRTAIGLALPLLMLALLAAGYEYRHLARTVDRRLAHSTLYATRPRVRTVARVAPSSASPALLPASYGRTTRRVPAYDALPPELVEAVVSTEDRRFFQHSGIDYTRTAACALRDALTVHIACGGSTITQQLARVDFLSPRQTLRRKLAEILIARRLEDRLTKQQIFAMYGQAINLGQQGSQPIKGFHQAARVYFGKDLSQLDLAQDALLAGMIHAPNFENPFRHPDRAARRRNVVLESMVATGVVSREQADRAKAEPLHLANVFTPDSPFELDSPDLGSPILSQNPEPPSSHPGRPPLSLPAL